jgi:hypothetical protein
MNATGRRRIVVPTLALIADPTLPTGSHNVRHPTTSPLTSRTETDSDQKSLPSTNIDHTIISTRTDLILGTATVDQTTTRPAVILDSTVQVILNHDHLMVKVDSALIDMEPMNLVEAPITSDHLRIDQWDHHLPLSMHPTAVIDLKSLLTDHH